MDENTESSKNDEGVKKRQGENTGHEDSTPLESKRAKLDEECSKDLLPKNANKKFKSPEMKRAEKEVAQDNEDRQISRLKEKLSIIEEEISKLSEFNCDELDTIINKLHHYNDVKDTAQFLLEKMANIKCVTIKKMHEMYGMNNDLD